MPGYVIARVSVNDPDTYDRYRREVGATVAAFGGRFLVRGGAISVKEGSWPSPRVVVLEFPAVAAAHAWYASPAYQAILPLRLASAEADVIIVEGAQP
jgi:uncharacterized protein (DUF1330 family)